MWSIEDQRGRIQTILKSEFWWIDGVDADIIDQNSMNIYVLASELNEVEKHHKEISRVLEHLGFIVTYRDRRSCYDYRNTPPIHKFTLRRSLYESELDKYNKINNLKHYIAEILHGASMNRIGTPNFIEVMNRVADTLSRVIRLKLNKGLCQVSYKSDSGSLELESAENRSILHDRPKELDDDLPWFNDRIVILLYDLGFLVKNRLTYRNQSSKLCYFGSRSSMKEFNSVREASEYLGIKIPEKVEVLVSMNPDTRFLEYREQEGLIIFIPRNYDTLK